VAEKINSVFFFKPEYSIFIISGVCQHQGKDSVTSSIVLQTLTFPVNHKAA